MTSLASAAAGRRSRGPIVAAAALLVAYALAHALLLHRFPWFVDETFFGVYTQAGAGDPAQRFGALIDHKGLIVQWIGMLLVNRDVAPVDALRLISIASGIIAAAAAGALLWRWWGDRLLALIVAAVVLFVPYFFVHDALAIYDPFVAGFSMVALALQLELARRPRLDVAMVLGVVLGVLVLAKPTGALCLVLLPFSLLVALEWPREERRRRFAAWAGCLLIALVITAALWSLSRLSPLAYTPAPANHRTMGEFFDDPFGQLSAVGPDAWRAMWGYLTPAGVVLAVWGLVRVVVERHRAGIVVAIWALVALAAYLLLTDTAYPRYGLQAVGPLCVLAVLGGADLWRRVWIPARAGGPHARWWTAGAVVLAVLALAPALILDARVLARPGDAPYPGLDRAQYNVLVSNRGPVQKAVKEILRRSSPAFTAATPPAQRTVAGIGGWAWAAQLALNGTHYAATPRFTYVDVLSDHKVVNAARFVIIDAYTPPDWFRLGNAKVAGRWSRPGGGAGVVLYDRGN
jgi:hypothetical protein